MSTLATKVRNCVEANLEEIDGPRDVAKELGVAYKTLRKSYRRKAGSTLGRLIRRIRVQHAKRLLRDPDLYCFEVCYEVGFSRDDVAARTFKRQTGMTMTEYRCEAGVPGYGGARPVQEENSASRKSTTSERQPASVEPAPQLPPPAPSAGSCQAQPA